MAKRSNTGEPFYIQQNTEALTERQRQIWIEACIDEAKRKGAGFIRYSIHPMDDDLCLIEAWKKKPRRQGQPRFSIH